MSHVEHVETTLVDLEACKAAAKRLGVEFVQDKKTYGWFGRHVGDHPLPPGVAKEDLGKCDHVIRVPGCTYEVGLVKRTDGKGYNLAYDFWGPGKTLQTKFGGKMEHLIDAYSVEALKLQAKRKGFLCRETTVNGKIKLTVTGF